MPFTRCSLTASIIVNGPHYDALYLFTTPDLYPSRPRGTLHRILFPGNCPLLQNTHNYFAERSRPSSAGIGRSAWGVIRAPWRASPDSLKSTTADCTKNKYKSDIIIKITMYMSSDSVIPNNNCVGCPLDTDLIVSALVDMIVQESQD